MKNIFLALFVLITPLAVQATEQESNKLVLFESDKVLAEILKPLYLRTVISEYLIDKKTDFFLDLPQFSSPIDITKPEVLSMLLHPHFQKEEHLKSMVDIAKKCYRIKREVYDKENKEKAWGFSFPADPEILAYAMQLARNEIALEIAGASGENAMFLAFAGAKKVYMNDISTWAVKIFNETKNKLPTDIAKKLEAIEGDCFDLIKQEKLIGKVGFVLCRNLLHFFTDEKQERFFKNLKKLLKPGAHAIFMVNSLYGIPAAKSFFEQNSDSTAFEITSGLLENHKSGEMRQMFYDIDTCSDSLIDKDQSEDYLYHSDRTTNYKWAESRAYKNLWPELKPEAKTIFDNNKEAFSRINNGSFRILKKWLKIYSLSTLSNLFEKYGFEFLQTFAVDSNGHLIYDNNLYGKTARIGILIRNSDSNSNSPSFSSSAPSSSSR